MKVALSVKVNNDDGSVFFAAENVVYDNLSREVYEFMEGEILDLLKSWNAASKKVTAEKSK